jgi:hypothetical protein
MSVSVSVSASVCVTFAARSPPPTAAPRRVTVCVFNVSVYCVYYVRVRVRVHVRVHVRVRVRVRVMCKLSLSLLPSLLPLAISLSLSRSLALSLSLYSFFHETAARLAVRWRSWFIRYLHLNTDMNLNPDMNQVTPHSRQGLGSRI